MLAKSNNRVFKLIVDPNRTAGVRDTNNQRIVYVQSVEAVYKSLPIESQRFFVQLKQLANKLNTNKIEVKRALEILAIPFNQYQQLIQPLRENGIVETFFDYQTSKSYIQLKFDTIEIML